MSQNIFVVAEHLKGSLTDSTFEILGAARTLANATGGQVVAVLCGNGVGTLATQMSAADRVLLVEDPSLEHFTPQASTIVLEQLIKEHQPRLTMLLYTSMGMDLAAGLSARLNLPHVAYCKGVQVDGGSIVATSQIYGGKIQAESAIDGSGIVSVLPGSFSADDGRVGSTPTVETVVPPAALSNLRMTFKALIEPDAGDVDITRSDIIVSVGRGIQSQDNIETAEELAKALGGVVASSRPVTDAGWLPRTRQVGKSGMSVKPKLYLALGISGAPEHLEGMKDAELIIAINTDQNAPIFDVAHYGVVADLFNVVDALQENL